MAYAVLIPEAIAAMNIDSYVRSVIDTAGSAIDNGNVFVIDTKHTTGSLTEVWEIKQPTAGSPTNAWMAYSGDEVVLTASKYKGLDPDPRNFTNAAGYVFSAFKPQVGDIVLLTADAFSNSFSAHTYAHAVADSFKLYWDGNDGGLSGLTFKYLATKYISLATGAINNQRVTAYELECVAV
jgi:hypothetical protein